MQKSQQKIIRPLYIRVISHHLFFWGVVVLFIINALWIALSAVYPMIFDEEFHLGVIEIYSHQLGPFINSQAAGTVFHGDLTRTNSYLFYYLMSFPFRFIALFTNDLATQVVILRVINILFVAVSLWVFRKLLLLGGFSSALTNIAILFFVLIPLVPFTAAHINYDNLIILFTAGIFYSGLRATQETSQQAGWVIGVLTLGLLGSLVKFTFLPVFVATSVFVAVFLWRQHNKTVLKKMWEQYKHLSKPLAIVLTLLFIVGSGLFIERYGGNLVQYRSLEPECDRIHSAELCKQYNIWDRGIRWTARYEQGQWDLWNPLEYTVYRWVPHIFSDLFITGAYTGGDIEIRKPLGRLEAAPGTIPLRVAGWAVFIGAVVVTAMTWRRLKLTRIRYLFLASIGLYSVALWIKNYSDYTTYGLAVATQGRYYILFLIPLIVMAGYAFSNAIKREYVKGVLLAVALLLFTQGAGATTYILYSNKNWYWPNDTVKAVNKNTQNILRIFIFKP